MKQTAEAFCLVSELASKTSYDNIVEGSFALYFLDQDGKKTFFRSGKEYEVDYKNGTVRRTAGSAVPDYSQSVFFNQRKFTHEDKPVYGNAALTVYADYDYQGGGRLDAERAAALRHRVCGYPLFDASQFAAKKEIVYRVFGDSISTGAEATGEGLTYFGLFAKTLADRYGVRVNIENVAIGGETTDDAVGRLQTACAGEYDILSIGYGMNDQNRGKDGNFVPLERYRENIIKIIRHSQAQNPNAQIILVCPCLPNDRWIYTSGDMKDYAEALRALSFAFRLPLADVTDLWERELEAGKTASDLLRNDINHPNNYGHYIYYLAMKAMLV